MGLQLGGFGGVHGSERSLGEGDRTATGGEQHPTSRGRTIALPSKNLCWRLGLGPGMLCQAGAWISPWRVGPAQKCQETIAGVPGCLLVSLDICSRTDTGACERDGGGSGKVTGFAPGCSVGCVGAGADAPTAETWSRVLTLAPCFFPQIFQDGLGKVMGPGLSAPPGSSPASIPGRRQGSSPAGSPGKTRGAASFASAPNFCASSISFHTDEGCLRGKAEPACPPPPPRALWDHPQDVTVPFPRQPGFMASFPLQTQTLLPQVPALVETETVATVGAGTSCYTGTPGDDDTSASRMTTPNVLSIAAQTLPATRKYPSDYQRPPEPCQAASASPRSAKAGGRGKRGAQPWVLSIMDSAPSSSCIPSAEHLCPAPGFILHQQSPLRAPGG